MNTGEGLLFLGIEFPAKGAPQNSKPFLHDGFCLVEIHLVPVYLTGQFWTDLENEVPAQLRIWFWPCLLSSTDTALDSRRCLRTALRTCP